MDDESDEHSSSYFHAQNTPTSSRWHSQSPRDDAAAAPDRAYGSSSTGLVDRPHTSRTNSLQNQRSSPSIFGSGPSQAPPIMNEDDEQQDAGASRQTERPPALAVSPPSQEHVPISQPPLSTLSTEIRKRGSWYEDDVVDPRRIPQVEKDADDPTAAPSASSGRMGNRRESTTLTTLSRLFAVQAPLGSPEHSRSSSFIQSAKTQQNYTRNILGETAALPDHLYTRGLMEGRHSDVTVKAFGQEYRLHRLVLDRSHFFRSALSEPWLESNAKETTVHPEDIDASITQASFELALKRLYGCADVHEEDRDAVGLFATGCWLEMPDLIESSIESMLRQMSPETLSPLIKLVTSNYYGRNGDKILASAKAMLCRDGWRMRLKYWDGIPGDIVREIVGGDGLFIDGEWERWRLAKRILDRRLRLKAIEAGLTEPGSPRKVLKAPDTTVLTAVRFDGVYRRNAAGTSRGLSDRMARWTAMYTHPDVEPILVLLDEGIHYIHLDFEQLQLIKDATDVFGLPVLSQKVVGDALWRQMELRQRVLNAREGEMELGVSVCCAEDAVVGSSAKDTAMGIMTPAAPPPSASSTSPDKGKHRAEDVEDGGNDEGMESGSWDGNGKPRKFWIPSSDCNIVMGGNADPIIATSNNTTLQRHASRLSATIQSEDVQWMSDFSAVTSQPRVPPSTSPETGTNGDSTANTSAASEVRYSHFPPFRFSAEFPNPRLLKEKKRVYSRTVFYAGSLWNIYIQKVASSRSKQLGVYLHRAKERETEEVIAGIAGAGGMAQGSVDERIGVLEREMLMRSERRERRQQRRRALGVDGFALQDPNDSDGDDADQDTLVGVGSGGEPSSSSSTRPSLMRDLLGRSSPRRAPPPSDAHPTPQGSGPIHTPDPVSLPSSSDSESETTQLLHASKRLHVPTLPPYVDARPTIKTYFKIYSPSRGGRMLSVYESAPDRFNFSQSWGWKSSTLMLDEGLMSDEEEGSEGAGGLKGRGDGKLRFMVVIGNI